MTDFDERAATWDSDPQKVDRALRVAAAIAARVPGLSSRRVLEYGCGTGLLGFALRPKVAEVTLADTSAGMLAELRRKITASGLTGMTPVQLDLATGAPPAGRFDLICSLMTLHHVRDTQALLHSFRGLLEPQGVVCLADLDSEDGSFHGPAVDVHHGFDRSALGRQLKTAGFRDPVFEKVLEIRKEGPAGPRQYPVFLVTAAAG